MFLTKVAYAQITNPILKNSQTIANNPTAYGNNVLQTLITLLIIFAVIFFFFQFIMSGYKMISSQGDPKKAEEAKSSLSSSVVGLIIVLSVFVILNLLINLFGIKLDSLTWPSL